MAARFLVALTFLLTLVPTGRVLADESLTIVMWNVESGDADPAWLARNVIPRMKGTDLIGLSEVQDQTWTNQIDSALEQSEGTEFGVVFGTTGRSDRLAVIFDQSELKLLGYDELHGINPGNRVRSPLVCRFEHRASGTEFLFCVNHLYRSNDGERHKQARQLNQWGAQQALPIILGGDMNFDWSVATNGRDRDQGFNELTANNVFVWARPGNIVMTHASTRYNSILDFIFSTANPPWIIKDSQVVVIDGDFPDDAYKSDHRPVAAIFEFKSRPVAGGGADEDDAPDAPDAPDTVDQPEPRVDTDSAVAAIEQSIRQLEDSIAAVLAAAEQLGDEGREQSTKRSLINRLERMQKDAEKLKELLERLE
jgi:hypothetical protein